MLAIAADTISVPRRPFIVNRKTVDRQDVQHRCEARRKVLLDKALSDGAKTLYFLLDEYAGMNAEAWPGQGTLARDLGISIRSVQMRLAELERAEYVAQKQTQSTARYFLFWRVPDTQNPAPPKPPGHAESCASDLQDPAPPYKEEPDQEPERACARCGGTGIQKNREHHRYGVREWQGKCGCRLNL